MQVARIHEANEGRGGASACPPALRALAAVCAGTGVIAFGVCVGWLFLVSFGGAFASGPVRRVMDDPSVGRFLTVTAATVAMVAAATYWGARQTGRGRRGGRKVLVTAIGLAHCIAFIATMVQFTLLPSVLRDLWPSVDPYPQLVHRQHQLLIVSGVGWAIAFAFDVWFMRVMSRENVKRAFAEDFNTV